MRTYDEILADARKRSPFSNSSQFEYWADGPRGCYSCRNDSMGGDPDEPEKFCPIISVGMTGATPLEFTTSSEDDEIHGNYTCTEYDERPDDDGGDDEPEPDPGPPPVIEGQIDMFEVFADQIADQASAQRAQEVSR